MFQFTSYVYVPGAGGVNVPPTGGSVSVTVSCSWAKRNVQLNSRIGSLFEAWRIAPASICIVFSPSTTGEVVKVKSIVWFPFDKVAVSAGVPFTVKSLAWTVDGSAGSLRLTVKSVGAVPITRLPQAGSAVVTEKPTRSLSVKASCWDCPLMVTRPSVHEVICLVAIAEP